MPDKLSTANTLQINNRILREQKMKKLGKIFLHGLSAILPITITIYIIIWLIKTAESALGNLIKAILTEKYYIPGMGVLAGILVVFAIGILLKYWLVKQLFNWSQRIMEKIPLVKTLYGSVSDLMSFFDSKRKKDFNKVVMVDMLASGVTLIGFVTREDFTSLPDSIGTTDTVAVYLPMSYQMGGFTVFVSKDKVTPVDMSVEDAMRFALTAAMSIKKQDKEKNVIPMR